MATLTYISIFIFVVLLCAMSLTAGTQPSFSALASKWRWLLLVTLWSQLLLLPPMLEVTPEPWNWPKTRQRICPTRRLRNCRNFSRYGWNSSGNS